MNNDSAPRLAVETLTCILDLASFTTRTANSNVRS